MTEADIVYEDNHLIIVNKKSGELVQGDNTGDKSLIDTIKDYLKKKYNKPGNVFLGLVHRLDRPVSGLVIFAKTSKALSRMSEMFRNGEVEKRYWAIVVKHPPRKKDTIESYLFRNQKQNKTYVVDANRKDAKLSKLSYTVLGSIERYHLLEIELHTGRHHQIRCQLSSVGSCIKGDLKYGASRSNKDASISLISKKLRFIHPVSKELISLDAELPKTDLWHLFNV